MTPYQVNVAAEAFASMVMSQAGYDVALQYGTNQPGWDILASKTDRTLKIQVKGSQDGGWGLFQSHIQNADYHGALDAWLIAQLTDIVYFFVQFGDVAPGIVPRSYIARPSEIVDHMRTTRAGHAYTSLRENYTYTRGLGAGHTDRIPRSWVTTLARIETVQGRIKRQGLRFSGTAALNGRVVAAVAPLGLLFFMGIVTRGLHPWLHDAAAERLGENRAGGTGHSFPHLNKNAARSL